MYEGEVTELTPVEAEPLAATYGAKIFISKQDGDFSGKTISHLIIGLKTCKGSKQLKLDPTIYDSILKQRIEIGDVIYIEANSGAVKVSVKVQKLRNNF